MKKSRIISNWVSEVIYLVLFILLFPVLRSRVIFALPNSSIINIAMDLVGIVVVILFNSNTLEARFAEARGAKTFPLLLLVEFAALYTDIFAWVLDGIPSLRWAIILDNTLFYMCSIGLGYFYLLFVVDYLHLGGRRMKFYVRHARNFAYFNVAVLLGNLIYPYIFLVDEAGVYSREFLYPITFLYPVCILLSLPFWFMKRKDIAFGKKMVLIIFCDAPILAGVIQTFTYGVSFIYVLTLLAIIILFALIYMNRGNELSAERAAVKEKELKLKEQKELIMLSQIQPQYIFSALTTISQLCHKDREEAYRLTIDFSDYLRHNLDSLSGASLDSFENELRHIEKYVAIEEKRLGDDINVVYDLGPMDFKVPVLSVQPLVENAVRHIGGDGNIWIRTFEDDDNWYVSVTDDAPLPGRIIQSDVMENIRSRLDALSSARLSVSSDIDGTVSTIRIPKNL